MTDSLWLIRLRHQQALHRQQFDIQRSGRVVSPRLGQAIDRARRERGLTPLYESERAS